VRKLQTHYIYVGAMFIRASQEWLEQFEDVRFEGLKGANAQKTLLVVAVMAAHALGEGSGVGVSFCGHRGWVQVRSLRSRARKQAVKAGRPSLKDQTQRSSGFSVVEAVSDRTIFACLQGVLVTLAIGLHNIPEGLAVATVLVARGVSPKQVHGERFCRLPAFFRKAHAWLHPADPAQTLTETWSKLRRRSGGASPPACRSRWWRCHRSCS